MTRSCQVREHAAIQKILAELTCHAQRLTQAVHLGMTGTGYTDPSGLDPSTTSTAADQVRLGMAAMRVPVLAEIAAMSMAVVPDFFLTAAGPVLNEVNTMPGFAEHSQVPKMFAAAGLPYPELLDLLVTDALAGRSADPACCGGYDDGQPAAG